MSISSLINKTFAGATGKYLRLDQKFLDRLKYEFEVIEQKGLTESMLIASTIADTCNESGFIYEAGQSLTTCSLVNYCLDIATLNPLKYGFLFESFFSSFPGSYPFFYFRIPSDRLKDLLSALSKKLPYKQIVTLVVRPSHWDTDYDTVIIENEEWKINYGCYLILDDNLRENIYRVEGKLFYPLHDPENDKNLAFKYNISESRVLSDIKTILSKIPAKYHPWSLPLDDTSVFEFLQEDDLKCILDLDYPHMQYLVKRYKPASIEELAFLEHLSYHESSDYLKAYEAGDFDYLDYQYENEQIRELLHETKGLISYEEQCLALLNMICGLSYSEGMGWIIKFLYKKNDTAWSEFLKLVKTKIPERGLLSKKDTEVLLYQIKRDCRKITLKSVWISSAILTYWIAYYKRYFPMEFEEVFDY